MTKAKVGVGTEDQMEIPEKTIIEPGSWVKRAGLRKNAPVVSKSKEEVVEPQVFRDLHQLLETPRDAANENHVLTTILKIKISDKHKSSAVFLSLNLQMSPIGFEKDYSLHV
jgi:hypothetical protein